MIKMKQTKKSWVTLLAVINLALFGLFIIVNKLETSKNVDVSPSIPLPETLAELPVFVESVKYAYGEHIITSIYTVLENEGRVSIPPPLFDKAKRWFSKAAPEDLPESDRERIIRSKLQRQVPVSVYNQWTSENTLFNPLRLQRPGAGGVTSDSDIEFVMAETDRTKEACDFCNPEEYTASDDFGRTTYGAATVSANIAKVDGMHGVLILEEHDPWQVTYSQLHDAFQAAATWFNKNYKRDPSATYPHLMWDVLPKASASQYHSHLQIFLGKNHYYGEIDRMMKGAKLYEQVRGRKYWHDLVRVHLQLELGVAVQDAASFAYLNPYTEKEVMVVGLKGDTEAFRKLVFYSYKAFREQLGSIAVSMGMWWPTLGSNKGGDVAVARFVCRGGPRDSRSDIGALDMFGAKSVSMDPLVLGKKLQEALLPLVEKSDTNVQQLNDAEVHTGMRGGVM